MTEHLIVQPTAELEEQFQEDVPCEGIRNRNVARPPCGKRAIMMRISHDCTRDTSHRFKCLDCYTALITHLSRWWGGRARGSCSECGQTFPSLEAYVRYEAI